MKIIELKAALQQRLGSVLASQVTVELGSVRRFLINDPTQALLVIQDLADRIKDAKPSSYSAERELLLVLALPFAGDGTDADRISTLLHQVRRAIQGENRQEWWRPFTHAAPKETGTVSFDLPDTGENWNLAAITLTVSYTQPH